MTRFLEFPMQSAKLMDVARRLGTSLDTLDYFGSGRAKRPASQVAQLQQAFPKANLAAGWGMTETNACGIDLNGNEYLDNPGTARWLYTPIQELAILDDDGQDVPTKEIGELTVKSACNTRCDLNKPQATDEVLQNGWLRTGDLGKIDEDYIITIFDHNKNILIQGGENIACLDIRGGFASPSKNRRILCLSGSGRASWRSCRCRCANRQRRTGDTRGPESLSRARDCIFQNSKAHMDTNRPLTQRRNRYIGQTRITHNRS